MISRQWHGLCKSEFAEEYLKHLKEETFPALKKIDGFIRASVLQRRVQKGVDFLVVTEWESLRSIEKFAGADVDVAVVPTSVRAMMLEYDQRVKHYEIL